MTGRELVQGLRFDFNALDSYEQLSTCSLSLLARTERFVERGDSDVPKAGQTIWRNYYRRIRTDRLKGRLTWERFYELQSATWLALNKHL